jgi:hypothetical protein
MSILETPAGFEVNSHWVASRVANFLEEHLQNFVLEMEVLPARKRGTDHSPDNPAIVKPLYRSRVVYLGAGSPTYAVRQLRGTLAWQIARARHRVGASLILASASVLSASAYTLPVYEIFKVGEDLHWTSGLDLLGPYGLNLALVPHWNNTEGGANLDTSHCFMGRARFQSLMDMLPDEVTVVGIDERTELMFELGQRTCHIFGPGGVTVIRGGSTEFFASEQSFPVTALGPFKAPERRPAGTPDAVWERIERDLVSDEEAWESAPPPPEQVLSLVEQRRVARVHRDWEAADEIRDEIERLGWEVRDTADGPELVSIDAGHTI